MKKVLKIKKVFIALALVAIIGLFGNQCFSQTNDSRDGFRVDKIESVTLDHPIIQSFLKRTNYRQQNSNVTIRNSNTEKMTLRNGVQIIKIEVENPAFNNLCIVAYKDGFISYFVNSIKDDVELFSTIDQALIATMNKRDYKLNISTNESSGQSSLGGGNGGGSSINASKFAACMANCEADATQDFLGWWSWNFGGGAAVAAVLCEGYARGWWLSPACNH